MGTRIILTIAIILFIQCNDQKKNIYYQFDKTEKVVFTDIDYPEILGIGMQLLQYDSLLLINDFHGDSLIHVFNTKTGFIQKKLIAKGNGPQELISPLDIQIRKNRLYILSRPLFSVNFLPLDSISSQTGPFSLKHISVNTSNMDRFLPINDSLFIFSGMFQKRYALINTANNTLTEYGEFPDFWEEERNIPKESKSMFHQVIFSQNEKKNMFATCSSHILEIYKFNPKTDQTPILSYQRQLGKYAYNYTDGKMVTAELKEDQNQDPYAYEFTSTDKYLYIVMKKKGSLKSNIMVIDWEGNPIKLIESEKQISCISVNENNQEGYCIIRDPEEKLVTFTLGPIKPR